MVPQIQTATNPPVEQTATAPHMEMQLPYAAPISQIVGLALMSLVLLGVIVAISLSIILAFNSAGAPVIGLPVAVVVLLAVMVGITTLVQRIRREG